MSLKTGLTYDRQKDGVFGLVDFAEFGSSREIGDHALVVNLSGLFGSWIQPVGYFVSRGATPGSVLKDVVYEVVRRCVESGLHPKLLICDQGGPNRSLANLLGVTIEKPFFVHCEHSIFFMFDPPHLLKSV